MPYVDGFVAAVPTKNKEAFIKHSNIAATCFKEFGAIQIVDCWGDDIPDGEITSFPMAVQKKDNETVLFGWVVWPDKATRDTGMQKAMDDPRMQEDINPMPFDGRRIIYGGFEVIIEK
ncbi:MAG: DUF1428 domain-containing protein [Pseudomonadota bacterium]